MTSKKVHFNENVETFIMRVWNYAHHQARKSLWEQHARDRFRFQRRILEANNILAPVLEKKISFIRNCKKDGIFYYHYLRFPTLNAENVMKNLLSEKNRFARFSCYKTSKRIAPLRENERTSETITHSQTFNF